MDNKFETHTDPCSCRKKTRDETERRDLMNRLKRIEGQVRGLQRMLNSFCRVLLASHIRTCVSEDIKAGREETVDELMDILQKLMK